jgi:hypothetical protein
MSHTAAVVYSLLLFDRLYAVLANRPSEGNISPAAPSAGLWPSIRQQAGSLTKHRAEG